MKYIIAVNMKTGMRAPIIFDDEIDHIDVANNIHRGYTFASAGFVKINTDLQVCIPYGKSESLGLRSSPEDAALLTLFMISGLSGLDLQNYAALMELEQQKAAQQQKEQNHGSQEEKQN